jgi:CRISPR-associated exonuclease Cas4
MKRIDLASGFEAVELGRLLHEEMFEREKKELRIGSIVIDFITKDGYVHETKSSKTMKEEHLFQPLFYVYYLREILGFEQIKGAKIHYPELKEVRTVHLDEKNKQKIEEKIQNILYIYRLEEMPAVHTNMRLCRKCAYFEFCFA